ncbi:hypothetical protein SKPI104516_16790 [Skermania piniformis]
MAAIKGDKYVTMIIDLTGIGDGTGFSRLSDMVEGCSESRVQGLARRTRQGPCPMESRWS